MIPIAALLLVPTAATAQTTLTGPAKRPWMDRCIRASQVQTPDLTLVVYQSTEPGRSYIAPDRLQVWLYGLGKSFDNCYVLRHEIGHLFDWTMLTAQDRRHIACNIIGQKSPNPWWWYSDQEGWASGAAAPSPLEQFAEAYAVSATVKHPHRRQSTGQLAIGYNAWDYLVDQRGYLKYRKLKRLARYISSRPGPAITDQDDQAQKLPEC